MTGSAEKQIELVIPVSHLDLAIWAVRRATESAFADLDEALVAGLGELMKKLHNYEHYHSPDGPGWSAEDAEAKDQERRELVSSLEEFFRPLPTGPGGSFSLRKIEVLMNLQVFLIDNLKRPLYRDRKAAGPNRPGRYYPNAVTLSSDETYAFLPHVVSGAMVDLALELLSRDWSIIGKGPKPHGGGFPKDYAELVGVLNYWRTAQWLRSLTRGPTFSGVSYNVERHDR